MEHRITLVLLSIVYNCIHNINLLLTFCYAISDPNHWADGVSNCKGEHQSPVNIDSSKAIKANFSRMSFFNYDKIFPETITNNGHTGNEQYVAVVVSYFFYC